MNTICTLKPQDLEFDVGVYFEANGHGTVLFSQRATETFQKASEDARCERDNLQLLAPLSHAHLSLSLWGLNFYTFDPELSRMPVHCNVMSS